MRLFAATLGTETNTFSPLPTGLATFKERLLIAAGEHPDEPHLLTGPLIAAREYVRAHGGEVVEGLCAFATPAGHTVQAVYEQLRDQLLADLESALPVDAVVLGLHGAMVSDDCDDCEGDLLARVREMLGEGDTVVGAALDLHCHLSAQMMDNADVLVTYKEYPHIDFLERGRELVGIVADTVTGRVKPHIACYDCRMIDTFHTVREPMKSFVEKMQAMERQQGVLSISAIHGFSRGDVPDMGAKMMVVTDDAPERGRALAAELGREFYALRGQGTPARFGIEEALTHAAALEAGPIVLADISDNAGGGAASDSTFVLQALLARNIRNVALGPLWDPVAVRVAMEAGQGAELDLRIGGKIGPLSGDPVDLRVTVAGICPNATQRFGDSDDRLGDCVCVTAQDIRIVLNSNRTQAFGPELFTNVGVDPGGQKLIVVKSAQHFYAGFAPLAQEVLYVDAPGSASRDITQSTYEKIKRPLWPFDDDPLDNGAP